MCFVVEERKELQILHNDYHDGGSGGGGDEVGAHLDSDGLNLVLE